MKELLGVQKVSNFGPMRNKTSGIAVSKVDASKRIIPRGSTERAAYWRVTLGKKITGGSKLRKFFKSEREAMTFVDDAMGRKKIEGSQAFEISPNLRVEARHCQQLLDEAAERVGRPLSLNEAVIFFLRHALPQGGAMTFTKAREAFLASRRSANLKPRYLRNLVSQFDQLAERFGTRRVNLISTRDLESWLDDREQSPKTRNNYVVTLRTFFTYCQGQKWCAENPAQALGKARVEDAPAGILSVVESRRLLSAVEEYSPRIFATVLIQLFAGLRRSEACALDWSEVKPAVIEVTAIKAKTRSRRVVAIQPNLELWLAGERKATGRVCPVGEDAYNEGLREAIEQHNKRVEAEAGMPLLEWKRNCLRHTCASMHLAHFSDEAKTALQMGHAVDVLHRHYKGLVTPEEAALFWAIVPAANEETNVIPMKAPKQPRARKAG